MKVRRDTPGYHFFADTASGITMRWGRTLKEDPIRAPWPELADISISNHCTKGCPFCYKNSGDNREFLSPDAYGFILRCLTSPRWGSVFQVALGGGEPLEHPQFEEILDRTRKMGIMVNFTTNGEHLDDAHIRLFDGKVSAVALSVSRGADIDPKKIQKLADAGIRVNLHFVLGNDSLDDAIALLNGAYNRQLAGVRNVIFLTYKPCGRAGKDGCLRSDDRLRAFLAMTDRNACSARIGFDACFVPELMRFTRVNTDFIDSCECGFFSVYVDEKLNVRPCSFCTDDAYSYPLSRYSMEEIWNTKFEGYRRRVLQTACTEPCDFHRSCRGNCVFYPQLSLCSSIAEQANRRIS